MLRLTKRQESMILALSSRHGRRKSEFCLCDGLRSSSEILSLRPDLIEFIILRKGVNFKLEYPLEPVVLEEKEFSRFSGTVTSQGIIVVARRPEYVASTTPPADSFALVLDRIGDPGNLGTIIRTARAAGLKEIWLVRGTVDPFSEKVLRAASGAQFSLGIRVADSLDDMAQLLKKHGIERFYRTLPDAGESVFRTSGLFEKSAIILGSEAQGVATLENSLPLNIPMPGTAESLNVAQAATIILFEYVRRMEI